jgi:two-component system OmpR family response regulator
MRQSTDAQTRRSRPPSGLEGGLTEPNVAGLRALVVDDHDDSRDLMAEMLRQAGCPRVTLASDAAHARRHLRAAIHDLVVTEVRLPDASDFELIDQAQADGLLPRTTTVVFCSTNRWLDAAARARGARSLFKPVNFDQVLQTVRGLVRGV